MNVVGFGACMINGFPYSEEVSFFNNFITLLHMNNITVTKKKIISLGGFTVSRAYKYLDRKVLPLNPDLVILQFGSTDASSISISKSIKDKILKDKLSTKKSVNSRILNHKYQPYSRPNIKEFLKRKIRYVIGRILNIEHSQPRKLYYESMEEIIIQLCTANKQVILLSPFIIGDDLGNYWAKRFSIHLAKLCRKYRVTYVNCHEILSKYENQEVLLNDSLHISEFAHKKIADEMWLEYQRVYLRVKVQ